MSLNHRYSKPTVLKALHWLNQQPHNWAEHIKDSNIAVKMYLKSQNTKNQEEEPSFKKEMQQFLKEDKNSEEEEPAGAVLIKKSSPPVDWPSDSSDFKEKQPTLSLEKKHPAFFLDEKSRGTLEKVKKELNIEQDQEALRVLIQLGQRSLNQWLSTFS